MSQLQRLILTMEFIVRVTEKEKPLHKKGVIHANHIADLLGVSIRTVYRDVECLQDAKIPVSLDVKKGYLLKRSDVNEMINKELGLTKDANKNNT